MRGVAQLAAFFVAVEVASAFAGQTAVVRPDGSAITAAQIDQSANRLMQSAHVTGAGIAIFHRGKIEYLKTYGARDAETGSPLTADSVMTSASLSKAAFATVVMRLVQSHISTSTSPLTSICQNRSPRILNMPIWRATTVGSDSPFAFC